MADKNYEFPFESGKLYKIFKVKKKSFSVCMLYDMVARAMHKYCTTSTLFNPRNIFISTEVYDRLFKYYLSKGHTAKEVEEKLSILGPKTDKHLKNTEVAISKACMYGESNFRGKEENYED